MVAKKTSRKSTKKTTTRKQTAQKTTPSQQENTQQHQCDCGDSCGCGSQCKCGSQCMCHSKSIGCKDGYMYFLGFIGALIYYISTATGFWMGVLGVLKAIVWPAMLVLHLLGL